MLQEYVWKSLSLSPSNKKEAFKNSHAKPKPKAGRKAQRKACDLYCDQLEEQHKVLVCKGGCNNTVHL